MKIVITNPGPQFTRNLAGLADRMANAIDTAANMIASMIEEACKIDIASSGKFGYRWIEGLHVQIDPIGTMGRQLTVVHDIPYFDIFESGGEISGKPLLWIGLSGTDAEGVAPSEYSGGLFSIRRPNGLPLMFSVQDKRPRYFGVSSVNIPQKFHLNDAITQVMGGFQSVFDTAWKNAE